MFQRPALGMRWLAEGLESGRRFIEGQEERERNPTPPNPTPPHRTRSYTGGATPWLRAKAVRARGGGRGGQSSSGEGREGHSEMDALRVRISSPLSTRSLYNRQVPGGSDKPAPAQAPTP